MVLGLEMPTKKPTTWLHSKESCICSLELLLRILGISLNGPEKQFNTSFVPIRNTHSSVLINVQYLTPFKFVV